MGTSMLRIYLLGPVYLESDGVPLLSGSDEIGASIARVAVSRVGRACGAPRTRPAAGATRDVTQASCVQFVQAND